MTREQKRVLKLAISVGLLIGVANVAWEITHERPNEDATVWVAWRCLKFQPPTGTSREGVKLRAFLSTLEEPRSSWKKHEYAHKPALGLTIDDSEHWSFDRGVVTGRGPVAVYCDGNYRMLSPGEVKEARRVLRSVGLPIGG